MRTSPRVCQREAGTSCETLCRLGKARSHMAELRSLSVGEFRQKKTPASQSETGVRFEKSRLRLTERQEEPLNHLDEELLRVFLLKEVERESRVCRFVERRFPVRTDTAHGNGPMMNE